MLNGSFVVLKKYKGIDQDIYYKRLLKDLIFLLIIEINLKEQKKVFSIQKLSYVTLKVVTYI